MAITIGIGMLARMMLGGKDKQTSDMDNSVVEPSLRGTITPLSLGINRITPVIGYVGDTKIVKTQADSGGKGGMFGGGGGDGPETIIYYQSALHILSIGEGAELTRIIQGGKTIFDTVITPSSHPSGSQLTTPGGSTFRIYWGEGDQDVDSKLSALTGVATRYPFMMYIVWNRKKLGDRKVWPNLEYEVFVKTQQDTLFGNDPIIDESIDPFSFSCNVTGLDRIFVDSDLGGYYTNESVITTTSGSGADVEVGYQVTGTIATVSYTALITEVSESGGTYTFRTQSPIPSAWYSGSGTLSFKAGISKGLNPAAILYQLLFETYPHGLGVDVADYNLTDLEEVFDYFALTATLFPASLLIKSNKSIRDGIGMVLQDCGICISWDSETSQYRFLRMATTDTPTTIDEEFFNMGDRATLDSAYAVLDPALHTYRFIDSNRKFKDSTIITSDDGKAKYTGMPNSKKVSMDTVRDLTTASLVSAYRDRENFVRAKFTIKLSKEKAGSLLGGLFNFVGITGNFRLAGKTVVPDDSTVKATFVEDAYSEVTSFVEKKASGLFPGDSSGAEEDVLVRLQEISRFTNPDEDGVFVVRVRQSFQIQGMVPYLSDSDVTYKQFNTQNQYAVGGKLLDEIPEAGPAVIVPSSSINSVGNTDVYAGTSTNSSRRASPVSITEDGNITSVSMYHDGGGGSMLLALYEDNSGSPDALLGVTVSTAVSASAGWQTIDLISPVNVSNGDTVWMAWVFSANPGIKYEAAASTNGNSSGIWSGGMPDPWGSASGLSYKYSIYISYQEVSTGVEFTITGPDAADVLDLSASDDEARWRSGEQLCAIGSELFFLRGISPTGTPGKYSLDGLIRARWGTVRATHAVSDNLTIFRAADIKVFKATFLIAGTDVYAKTVPFTATDIMDISEITAEMITYQGGGFRPHTPINLNTEDRTAGFETGVDTTFVWGYRNTTGGAGAGLGYSNDPYNNPLPEGYFRLEFLTTGDTIVRTVDLLTVPTYEYSNANRVSDFGSNDFKVRVYNILNSLESEYDELEVEVV